MATRDRERLAPLTGIVAVILWVIGVIILESGDTGDETAADLVTFFQNDETAIYLAGSFLMGGFGFFLWFASSLRSAFLVAEGGTGRLTSIFHAASIATSVAGSSQIAPQISGAFAANEGDAPLEAAAAQALWFAGDGFFVVTEYAAALFFIVSAVLIFRTRVLPVWLAWVSLLFGLVALVGPIGWAVLVWGLPLWLIAVSILLYRRGAPRPAGDMAAAR